MLRRNSRRRRSKSRARSRSQSLTTETETNFDINQVIDVWRLETISTICIFTFPKLVKFLILNSLSRSSSFQNDHKDQEEKIRKIIERFKHMNVSEGRRQGGRMSLVSFKEDSKEEPEAQFNQKSSSPHNDVDIIEYSCDFCDFQASDQVEIDLHCYKKHKMN